MKTMAETFPGRFPSGGGYHPAAENQPGLALPGPKLENAVGEQSGDRDLLLCDHPISLPGDGGKGRRRGGDLSPDGTCVVTATADGTAWVWDIIAGRPVTPPMPHPDRVYHATFSPDGTRLVTDCIGGTARVWDVRTGQLLLGPLPSGGGGATPSSAGTVPTFSSPRI